MIKWKSPKKLGSSRIETQGLVQRIAVSIELAWNEVIGFAADLNLAVFEGTYEQHVEVMEKQFDREQAIRKKYAQNKNPTTHETGHRH